MKKKLSFFFRSDFLFFSLLSLSIIILFHKAFGIGVFKDDYSFFHLNKVQTIFDFFKFFSPIRDYPYRPLPSNLFYYILNLSGQNIVFGHVVVFITYFIGLVLLYKIIKSVTKNSTLSRLSTIIYALHFSHVFQLYWLATFEEILLFTSLAASFYSYLKKKIPLSIAFFLVALLSKETAMLYVPFLIAFEVLKQKRLGLKENKLHLSIFAIIVLIFYLTLYRYNLTYVTSLDNYKIELTNIKLFLNNAMWYLAWSLGVPSFMPDVMKSIFLPPLPVFKKYLEDPATRIYFYVLIPFLSLVILSFVSLCFIMRKKILKLAGITLTFFFFFYTFLGPMLFFRHKWMVRLTLPYIFVAIFIAWIILQLKKQGGFFKFLAGSTLAIFFLSTIIGIKVHESSSTYLLETSITSHMQKYFKNFGEKIIKYQYVYFRDSKEYKVNFWKTSEKLKVSFQDQDFLDYYLPGSGLKAVYGFENSHPPQNSYIINSLDILK